jgi:hypothetical protein
LVAEKCYLGFAGRMRSEQSNEPTAEGLQEIDNPGERVAHCGIYASPDEISSKDNQRQTVVKPSARMGATSR